MQIYQGGKLSKYAEASGSDIHVDVPLSNFAVQAFNKSRDQYVAGDILPMVSVGKQSDRYYVIEKDGFLRIPDAKRSPGTPSNRVKWTVSSDSYFADNYALTAEIPIEELANADAPVRLRENSVDQVVQNLLLSQEDRVATLLTTSGNLGTSFAVASAWSDITNSNPIVDVNSAHAAIQNATGLRANTLLMDWDSWQFARRNANVADLFKHTGQGLNSVEVLRNVFEVDRILIGRAIKNTAADGQTAATTPVWGHNAILAHVDPNAQSNQSMNMGARFNWRGNIYPADLGVLRDTDNRAGSPHVELVEAGHFQDEKIVAADLGVLIASTF